MDRDEERRIIAQVCAGDANAFEALVVAYQKHNDDFSETNFSPRNLLIQRPLKCGTSTFLC